MDDLIFLNKAGIMSPDMSTLPMINKAKSRFEEEQLRRIALASSPQPQPQPQPVQQGQGQE
jgi:hypothetical protein